MPCCLCEAGILVAIILHMNLYHAGLIVLVVLNYLPSHGKLVSSYDSLGDIQLKLSIFGISFLLISGIAEKAGVTHGEYYCLSGSNGQTAGEEQGV